MSFSFGVSGSAGPGVIPSDDDEGARVRQFCSDVLDLGIAHGLSVAINNVSPEKWQPDVRQKVATVKPQPPQTEEEAPSGGA